MSSADKQLLGTEATRALRAKGVESIICGLSANDMEKPFVKAGANCFCVKPFPCEQEELKREMHRVLSSAGTRHFSSSTCSGTTEESNTTSSEIIEISNNNNNNNNNVQQQEQYAGQQQHQQQLPDCVDC